MENTVRLLCQIGTSICAKPQYSTQELHFEELTSDFLRRFLSKNHRWTLFDDVASTPILWFSERTQNRGHKHGCGVSFVLQLFNTNCAPISSWEFQTIEQNNRNRKHFDSSLIEQSSLVIVNKFGTGNSEFDELYKTKIVRLFKVSSIKNKHLYRKHLLLKVPHGNKRDKDIQQKNGLFRLPGLFWFNWNVCFCKLKLLFHGCDRKINLLSIPPLWVAFKSPFFVLSLHLTFSIMKTKYLLIAFCVSPLKR